MLDPQLPPPRREMWSWLGRDRWAKTVFHPGKHPSHPVAHPMARTARAVLLAWPLGSLMSFIPPPKSFPVARRGQRGGNQEVIPGGPSVSWRFSISLPWGQNRGEEVNYFFYNLFFFALPFITPAYFRGAGKGCLLTPWSDTPSPLGASCSSNNRFARILS